MYISSALYKNNKYIEKINIRYWKISNFIVIYM